MILDLVVIGVIAVSGVLAAKQGFVRTVYQFTSTILALFAAWMIYPVIQAILKVTPLYEALKMRIAVWVEQVQIGEGLQQQAQTIQQATEHFPAFIGELLIRNNNVEVYKLLEVETVVEYIVVSLTNLCMMVVAILLAWVIAKLILGVVIGALDIISKLPLIKTANQLAGFVIGILRGFLIVWLVFLMMPIFTVFVEVAWIETAIETSSVARLFYEHNFILIGISQMMIR